MATESAKAHGCRVDLVRISGWSVLERYCERHLQAVQRQARAQQPRVALLGIVGEAVDRVLPATDGRPEPEGGPVQADHAWLEDPTAQDDARPGGAPGRAGHARSQEHGDGPVPDSVQAAMDAELRVVEDIERLKAALDAQALTALARMRSSAEALVASQPAAASRVPVEPVELVTMEVGTATGLGQREVGIRVELATGSARRFGRLRDLLGAGEVSLRRACQVVEETRHLVDDELVDTLVGSVFAPTRDGSGLAAGLFRQRLRRAILRADTDAAAAAARRREARRRNGARARVFDDGTGELTIRNDADKVAAAMDRADSAARAAKAAGDPRSLDQLRADFLTGAAIFGQPPTPSFTCGVAPHGAARCAAASTDAGAGCAGCADATADRGSEANPSAPDDIEDAAAADGPAPSQAGPGCGQCGCMDVPDWFGSFGRRPPGRVWLVVPVTTAFGLDDAPCELPGHGWIAAEQARQILTAEGSIWQAMLADLDTGRALDLSRTGYRPSRAMVEHIVAVDGVCRGPGCTVPASQCDIDHDIPYPDGPTDVRLLSGKHRQHHRVRTAGFWTAVRDPEDATITWRTSAGRSYVTYPADWLDEARPRRRFGGVDHNPEPITRPYGPAPDPDAVHDPGPPPF